MFLPLYYSLMYVLCSIIANAKTGNLSKNKKPVMITGYLQLFDIPPLARPRRFCLSLFLRIITNS